MARRFLYVPELGQTYGPAHTPLTGLPSHWEAQTAPDYSAALTLLSAPEYCGVVVELPSRAPHGLEFLDAVMRRHPKILRMVIADLADPAAVMQCASTAHQLFARPCDGGTLAAALDRAVEIGVWAPTEASVRLLAQMRRLPSPPKLYFELDRLLNANAALDEVGQAIANDPAMSAKLLQLVNSTSFGLQNAISDPKEAVLFMGCDATKSLVLMAQSLAFFDPVRRAFFSLDRFWQHSLAVGRMARAIAKCQGASETTIAEAYTAGLLHDIGKLAFAANLSEQYSKANALAKVKRCPLHQAEQQIFGSDHAEIGGNLLAIWGLPMAIVEAIALHHQPRQHALKQFCVLTAVHAADALFPNRRADSSPVTPDVDYLAELGLAEKLADWQEAVATICPRESEPQSPSHAPRASAPVSRSSMWLR